MRPTLRSALSLVAITAVLGSCSSGGSTTNNTQTMAKYAGDNQSATVSTAVATKPAVRITDQNGAGVSGISVTFAVASGGGAITLGSAATTGSDGIATLPSNWVLGSTAGTNTMTASASGVSGSPVTFVATGTALVPVPTNITKASSSDNQTYAAGTLVGTVPSITVKDQLLNPMPGIAVTFTVTSGGGSITGGSTTTNASGVATLGSWTLGAAGGANTLSVTIAGYTGGAITFTETGVANFAPSSNTAITGTQTYGAVNIPSGVIVTLSGDATLNVIGNVNISGSIVGDCKNLTISAQGAFTTTATGAINTSCSGAVPLPAPALLVIATGGYSLSGGTITVSGAMNITNDATLTDATFAAPPAPGLKAGGASLRTGACIVAGANFIASPFTATDGNNGQFGTDGADGSTWTLQCTGELDLNGGVLVHGQYGGKGGTGTHTTTATALATGGKGGLGGIIRVRSVGPLVVQGAGNNVQSGSGGAGGPATATSTGTGNPGPSATATGGSGAAPGNIILQAKNGSINIAPSSLTLTMGDGGAGGAGTATGGTGQTALPCPAGAGGAATASGGNGGIVPDRQLTATGGVVGTANVTVAGGAGGAGGAAKATGGTGGGGAQTCKNGGTGGAPSATGGNGGNSLLKDAAGALAGNGGNGGSMEDAIGKGGQGWNDCVAPLEAGGNGGAGGTVAGKNGSGGTGKQAGTPGSATFTTVANGGNGGNGFGPGDGGVIGGSNAANTVVATTVQPSFTPGTPGQWCAVNKNAIITITNPPVDDPSSHETVLQFTTAGRATVFSVTGFWTQLFPGNAQAALICTFNTATGVVTCQQTNFTFSGRLITNAVFTGTVVNGQLVGDLVLTISGQQNTVKYHIVDP